MEKPKDCKECQWHLDFYIEDEQVGGLCTITEKDDKENICPLIELEEWTYSNGKMYVPKGTFKKILDDERRADNERL